MFLITFDFKKENFFLFSCPPLFKVYKKVVKFSFTQQKIFRVLVFSIRYLAYLTDRSYVYWPIGYHLFIQIITQRTHN